MKSGYSVRHIADDICYHGAVLCMLASSMASETAVYLVNIERTFDWQHHRIDLTSQDCILHSEEQALDQCDLKKLLNTKT